MFDGRVRNGNGSDHSFMATKKCRFLIKNVWEFVENCTQEIFKATQFANLKSQLSPGRGKKAIKPHDRLVLVR